MGLEIIDKLKKQRGLTNEDLAKLSGIPKGTIDKITAGSTKDPKLETVRALAKALGCTLNDFMDDAPPAEFFTASESKMIKKYRALDEHGKEVVDLLLDKEVERVAEAQRETMEAAEELAPAMREMIVYSHPAAAGVPLYAEDDYERVEFPENEIPWGADFGVRISGRSMEPTVMDGAIVWVRQTANIGEGEIGIFMVDDSAVCKRFHRDENGLVSLLSDNPEYGPVVLNEDSRVMIVGQLVGCK